MQVNLDAPYNGPRHGSVGAPTAPTGVFRSLVQYCHCPTARRELQPKKKKKKLRRAHHVSMGSHGGSDTVVGRRRTGHRRVARHVGY